MHVSQGTVQMHICMRHICMYAFRSLQFSVFLTETFCTVYIIFLVLHKQEPTRMVDIFDTVYPVLCSVLIEIPELFDYDKNWTEKNRIQLKLSSV